MSCTVTCCLSYALLVVLGKLFKVLRELIGRSTWASQMVSQFDPLFCPSIGASHIRVIHFQVVTNWEL